MIDYKNKFNYCLEQIEFSLKSAFVKRKLEPTCLNFKEIEKAGGQTLRRIVEIKEGIDQETAKKITKYFKQSKLKLQASIQGDEVRISGKSRDELQQAIQEIKAMSLGLPLQFINFRD